MSGTELPKISDEMVEAFLTLQTARIDGIERVRAGLAAVVPLIRAQIAFEPDPPVREETTARATKVQRTADGRHPSCTDTLCDIRKEHTHL